MTTYAGEQHRIIATGKEYGGTAPLTDTNVTSVSLTILDLDATILLADQPMTWNADESLWEYKWDTDGLPKGTYKYKVLVIGADGGPSFEWGRARLAKQPTITV